MTERGPGTGAAPPAGPEPGDGQRDGRPVEPPGRRRRRRALLLVALVVVGVLGGVAWYLRPIAPIATGYAAKIVCSAHILQGRSVEDASGDLPDNPLVPLLRTSADDDGRTVTTSLLGLWRSTAAVADDGTGCTLTDDVTVLRARVDGPTAVPPNPADVEWPAGDLVDTAAAVEDLGLSQAVLDAGLDVAFREDPPEGGTSIGTRAVVVVHEGRVVAERHADGFGPDIPLLGWSMSKSIGNVVVGRLAHDGAGVAFTADGNGPRLVDGPPVRPGWRGDERAAITLEHLLQMRSGLSFEEVYDPDTDATRMLFTPRSTAGFAASQPLVAAPGSTHHYSSGTTNIVCAAATELAVAAGLTDDAASAARDLVFAPLGMTSAVMEVDAAGQPVCSSFTYATARDWARLGQLALDDGVWQGERLLPPGWIDWSTTPVEDPEDGNPYGAHWWLNTGRDGERRMPSVPAGAFWASGNEGQQVVVIPEHELVVVRLGLTRGYSGIEWGLEPFLHTILHEFED